MNHEKISVNRAFWIGYALVNGPLMFLMFGLFFLSLQINLPELIELAAMLFVPIAAAWVWWSVVLPRWRVWALERVDDPVVLLNRAIESRLMWPPGHMFERTEIHAARLRHREREVGWIPPSERNASS